MSASDALRSETRRKESLRSGFLSSVIAPISFKACSIPIVYNFSLITIKTMSEGKSKLKKRGEKVVSSINANRGMNTIKDVFNIEG